jgi:hypothetical protein
MSSHHYKTWAEAAGLPETYASLKRLPADLGLPDKFPEPIQYDPATKRLVYRGFMCSKSYAFLRECSRDLEFLEALDSLFEQTAAAMSARVRKPRNRIGRWLLAAAVAIGAVVLAWKLLH